MLLVRRYLLRKSSLRKDYYRPVDFFRRKSEAIRIIPTPILRQDGVGGAGVGVGGTGVDVFVAVGGCGSVGVGVSVGCGVWDGVAEGVMG